MEIKLYQARAAYFKQSSPKLLQMESNMTDHKVASIPCIMRFPVMQLFSYGHVIVRNLCQLQYWSVSSVQQTKMGLMRELFVLFSLSYHPYPSNPHMHPQPPTLPHPKLMYEKINITLFKSY